MGEPAWVACPACGSPVEAPVAAAPHVVDGTEAMRELLAKTRELTAAFQRVEADLRAAYLIETAIQGVDPRW